MKDKVLLEVRPEENKTYIDNFLQLVSKQTPRLSISEIEKLNSCFEKSVIGQALDCFGYETALRLMLFENVVKRSEHIGKSGPYVDRVWLVTACIGENCNLSIGYKDRFLEIFKENSYKALEEYFLTSRYSQSESTNWLIPPTNFLKETFNLLPMNIQSTFKKLAKNQTKRQ